MQTRVDNFWRVLLRQAYIRVKRGKYRIAIPHSEGAQYISPSLSLSPFMPYISPSLSLSPFMSFDVRSLMLPVKWK